MAKKSESESPDFLQPWKFSDVVLVVEEERLHVHRAVLAMWSPVFERMFMSEFQEKNKNEILLPGKKWREVIELLQVIYPSVTENPTERITRENCHFLLKLAHEYQMGAIVQRCENVIIERMRAERAIAELVFAQDYNLQKLRKASIDMAANLTLQRLKNNKMYDQIQSGNLKEIMEGMILRLQRNGGVLYGDDLI